MANQKTENTELKANLFEELSDADLMAVVGGTLTKGVTDEGSNVVGFADKTTNFDELGKGVSAIGKGIDAIGVGIGAIGGFVTAD